MHSSMAEVATCISLNTHVSLRLRSSTTNKIEASVSTCLSLRRSSMGQSRYDGPNRYLTVSFLTASILMLSCAPAPSSTASSARQGEGVLTPSQKELVVAVRGEPPS